MVKIVRNMREQVYDVIKERIFSQEYDLGDQINIATLSAELSISNSPVREALSMLCAEGLVTSNVNSKFSVIDLDEDMMVEINEIFYILLSGSYRVCHRIGKDKELLELLESACKEQEKMLKSNDQCTYIRKAINFDRCFVAVTRNIRLINNFDQLADLLFLAVRYAYQHSKMAKEDNLKEHHELINAVKECSLEKVDSLLLKHYDKHFMSA